jgi:hypothetical protein
MQDAGRQIAGAFPDGRLEVLPDQAHVVPPEILASMHIESMAAHASASGDHEQVGRGVGG